MTKEEYIEKSKAVIDLIGTNTLTHECDNTYQHLVFWKNHGIPKAWARFLELRFPKEWHKVFRGVQVFPPKGMLNNEIPSIYNPLTLAQAVIEEITPKRLQQDLKITMGAISQWKIKGIPSARLPYLQLRFPNLKAWRLLKK